MENSILGGKVEFKDNKEFHKWINDMTYDDAIRILKVALELANEYNLYTLEDSFVITKCLHKLEKEDEV